MRCRKSCFEYIFLIDNLNITVNLMPYICGNKHLYKWRGSGHLCKIAEQTFRQILPPFAARISGVFADVVETCGESRNF